MRTPLLTLAASLLLCGVAQAETLDVCPTGCTYSSIQDAIDASGDGDVILVQPGIYYEHIDFSGKAITVSGAGSDLATIDGSKQTGSVVTFDQGEGAGSVLEGFRIGHGTGTYIIDPVFGNVPCGGGIFVMDSSPVIRDCEISSNTCWGGAGMMNLRSSPLVERCLFTMNASIEGHGGGAYNLDHSDPEFIDCTFEMNEAYWGGGMTSTVDCIPTVTDCLFVGNSVFNVGGGMFNRSRSSPIVTGCTFFGNMQTGNPLGSGGGMCTYGSGNGGGPCYPVLLDCHFEGNSVTGDGGGMSNAYDSHPTISNCSYVDNHAGRNGGGMACVGNADPYVPSNAAVTDCFFSDNHADEFGGGFHSRSSAPSVEGSIFQENVAGIAGGGASFDNSDTARLGTTTFCGNLPGHLYGTYHDLGGNTEDDACVDCDGDFNGDGTVNVDDLLAVIAGWGNPYNVDDLLLVIGGWGPCP